MTLDEVAAAVATLEAAGLPPTANRVLAHLGKGSKRDVLPLLRAVRAGAGDAEPALDPLYAPDDPDLDPALDPDFNPLYDPDDPDVDPALDPDEAPDFNPLYDPDDPDHFDPRDPYTAPAHAGGPHPVLSSDQSSDTQQGSEMRHMKPHDPRNPAPHPVHSSSESAQIDPRNPALRPQGDPDSNPYTFPLPPAVPATPGPALTPAAPATPATPGPARAPAAPAVQRYKLRTMNWWARDEEGSMRRLPVGTIMRFPGDLTALDLKVNGDLLELIED